MVFQMLSNVSFHPLSNPEVASSLHSFHRRVLTALGPHGSLSLIPGGASSCSSRLLSASLVSNKNPSAKALTRVVISAAHTLTNSDSALWCAAMCLGLLQGYHNEGNPGPAMSKVGSLFIQCLKESSLLLDLSGIGHMRVLVESVLGSKPGPGLTPRNRKFLTGLILEAFLGLIPSHPRTTSISTPVVNSVNLKFQYSDSTQMNHADGLSLKQDSAHCCKDESYSAEGYLLQKSNAGLGRNCDVSPELKNSTKESAFYPDPGHIRLIFVGGMDVSQSFLFPGLLIKMTDSSSEKLISSFKGSQEGIKTLLITDSIPELPVKHFEGKSRGELEESLIEEEWVGLQRRVEKEGLRILFCQKVVHPRLKKRLRRCGVLVLDKLGAETVKYLKFITGSDLGMVSSIEEKTVGREKFILLESSNLYSLLLCCYGEQPGQELVIVCRQAIDALFRVMSSTRLSFGGGCGEVMAMEKLLEKLQSESSLKAFTSGQIEASCNALLHALRLTLNALHRGHALGVASNHLWRVDPLTFIPITGCCSCGRVKAPVAEASEFHCTYLSAWKGSHRISQTTEAPVLILDELSAKVKSFALAFETASLLLRTTVLVDNSSPVVAQA